MCRSAKPVEYEKRAADPPALNLPLGQSWSEPA